MSEPVVPEPPAWLQVRLTAHLVPMVAVRRSRSQLYLPLLLLAVVRVPPGNRMLVEAQVSRLVGVVRVPPIQLVPELPGKVSQAAQVQALTLTPRAAVAVPVAQVGLQAKQMAQTQVPGGGTVVSVWRQPSPVQLHTTAAAAAAAYTVRRPSKTLRGPWVA